MNDSGDIGSPAGPPGSLRTPFGASRTQGVLRTRPPEASPWLFDASRTDFRRLVRDTVPRAEQPVPEPVLRHARAFLKALGTLPDPSVCRDPDGGLAFEWVEGDERCLRVRIDADGMLVYSGRLGERRRVSGAEPVGAEVPRIIREAIRQVAG